MLAVLTIVWIALAAWLVALAAKGADGSWVTPACLFALIWAAYIPTILFFAEDPSVFVAGMLWILVGGVLPVYVGSVLAGNFAERRGARAPVASPRAIRAIRWVVLCCVTVGLADVTWLFAQRGFSVRDMVSFAVVSQVVSLNRSESYAGEANTPVLQRLAFTALYLGALYAGVLFRMARQRGDKARAVLCLLLVVVVNTLHGSRFGSIYGGGFWLSSYLASHVALSDPAKGTGAKFLVRFALVGGVVIFLFSVMTMGVRYFVFTDRADDWADWHYILSDAFGFHAAFGLWLKEVGLHPEGPFFGARTFRRLFGLFGPTPELYLPVEVGFNSSNVYTVFRELIEDFTLLGSVNFLILVGFVGRLAHLKTASGRHNALPWLALAYAFLITSVASSAFAYTTITAAAILFAVTFRLLPPVTEDREQAGVSARLRRHAALESV